MLGLFLAGRLGEELRHTGVLARDCPEQVTSHCEAPEAAKQSRPGARDGAEIASLRSQ
jgi:hypothetical protein